MGIYFILFYLILRLRTIYENLFEIQNSDESLNCISLYIIFAERTYLHNWSLQPFSQDYNIASHTTYVLWVNFIHEWGNLQFKVDRFLRSFFMAIWFTLRVFARTLLRVSRRRNIFVFSVWCLSWDLNSSRTFNKPIHHLLDYGDWKNIRK